MATISNTPRPGYVWDSTDNVWYPIGVGAHQHTNAADTPAVMPYSTYAAAGKNKIINGDFSIWQRGTTTTFTVPTSGGFVSDRWQYLCDDGGSGSSSKTISQQAFTPGTAPVSGYEGQYFIRVNSTVASSTETYSFLTQLIEDVRTLAGQTATFSFWAKAASAVTLPSFSIRQSFGSGGSAVVDTTIATNIALTTSWQRFTYTFTVPSVSGKTIGAGSFLRVGIFNPLRSTFTTDFWGVQLEAGSVATAFQTATGNPASELAACQRYYYRSTPNLAYGTHPAQGQAQTTTAIAYNVNLPQSMRVTPTSMEFGNLAAFDSATVLALSSITIDVTQSSPKTAWIGGTVSGATQFRSYFLLNNNNSAGFIGISAEL